MTDEGVFGSIAAQTLSIGDMVEWSRWNTNKKEWDMHYGIITDVSNEIRSNRLVSICKVMPLNNTNSELEFFTLSLRLISPSLRKEYTDDVKN